MEQPLDSALTESDKPAPKRKRAPNKTSGTPKKRAKKKKKKTPPGYWQRKLAMLAVETVSLTGIALSAIIFLLGYSAEHFTGTDFFNHLLPFALGVLLMILFAIAFMLVWQRTRRWLHGKAELLTPALAAGLAIGIGYISLQDNFALAYTRFRTLVGGKAEAGRITLSHQIYAAYRRYDSQDLQKIMQRAQTFTPDIEAAAEAFDVDVNILHGIAAAESSFKPRTSADGGQGLFQITKVPKSTIETATEALGIEKPDLNNPKHNAYIAAATFKHYLSEMHDDLFLALLAYNIGPSNGGLRFIMDKYHVSTFTGIQPYLQEKPRGYPVRVLSYALAFSIWRKEGQLLPYEEGQNAIHIQALGIPGLNDAF